MYLNEKTPLRQIEALLDALSIFVSWLFLVVGISVLYMFASAVPGKWPLCHSLGMNVDSSES